MAPLFGVATLRASIDLRGAGMTVPALRFARAVANQVHECAPDHAIHSIVVGELREAVAEMADLYDALDELSSGQHGWAAIRKAKRALAKARGDR